MSTKKDKKETKKTKETKVKEEVQTNEISKLNNDLKKFKIVLGGMATIMTVSLVGGGYLLYDKLTNDKDTETTADYTTYTENMEKALKDPTKVKSANIEKLVEKQEKGDYTLQTMIDVLGENPAYIVQNTYEVTYEKDDVKKVLKNFMNKKSYKDSETLIELVWITDDGKSITTYLASDITDKVNVVGLFVYDETLDSSKIETNDKITKTKLTFDELADVEITLEELEDKVGGTLYHYSVQYPLLKDSEIVKTNTKEEDIDSTIKQSVFKNETSSIVVYSRDNDVLSISDVPFDYKDVKAFENDVVKDAKDNDDLTLTEFSKTFEGAKFVAVEETDKEDVLCKTYLIKDKDDNVYSVGFEGDKLSYFEQYMSGSDETEEE